MRRTLTTSFVALALVFGAAACGGDGAQQQRIEEQQQRIEEQQQQIQEQQQQIDELQAAPVPEGAPIAPGGTTQEDLDVAPLPETTPQSPTE